MKTLFGSLILLLFLFSGFTSNHENNIGLSGEKGLKFNLIHYGIYSVKISEAKPDSTSPLGSHNLISGLTLVKQTDTIPCVIGTNFFVEFMLETERNTEVSITVNWKFPYKMKNEETGKEWSELNSTSFKSTNRNTFTGYTLEKPNELLPGPWVLTISNKKKVLFTKTFIVVK